MRKNYKSIAQEGLTPATIVFFQKLIYRYYVLNGRSFPWRETYDPYHILVSEIMLQQTQTTRVESKYREFISEFPDFISLARASVDKVLRTWKGLGYNRRAIALHQTAKIVVEKYGGRLPDTADQLRELPGIGPNTAGALLAIAFNRPAVYLETNIRTVYHYFFFPAETGVDDGKLRPLIEATLDEENPRRWYYALYDYGAMLKREGKATDKLKYKQSPFEGSNRQLRGRVLRLLAGRRAITERELIAKLEAEPERARPVLEQLRAEGFIDISEGTARLRE